MALPLLIAASFCASGCESSSESTTEGVSKSRAAAVEGPASSAPSGPSEPTPAPPTVPAASSVALPLKPPLCAGQLAQPPRDLPKTALKRAGDKGLPEKLTTANGAWTWINFWAAWCVPCKEEIPRLKSWEERLSSASHPMRVLFISLDDDPRQLETFLAAEPASGLRSTYWLRDGEERNQWLKGIQMETEPELPAHLLVDPKGKLRCVIQGAVEDKDFERVSHLLSRRF